MTAGPGRHASAPALRIRSAIVAGVITAVVGFTSSFAVVLTGLRAVGADPQEAASGLLVLSVTMGLGCVWFSWRTKMPVTLAWSTPGAALLASAAVPHGGFAAAVGSFVVAGLLLAACGLIRPLGKLVESIPTAIASAMLAGVLLPLCAAPFVALGERPRAIAPVLIAWLLLTIVARRWAVPGALVVAVVVMIGYDAFEGVSPGDLSPQVAWVTPAWEGGALLAISLPLFIVTMTSQNIPGIAVLSSFGYRPDMRPPLAYAGLATAAGAPGGGHAINLAAISAALAAGPEAHPDPARRWVAGVSCGITYLILAPISGAVVAVAAQAPAGLMESIAGVALLGALAAALAAAVTEASMREAGAITLVVAASGLTVAGIGPAFWGLVAGLVMVVVMRVHQRMAGNRRTLA